MNISVRDREEQRCTAKLQFNTHTCVRLFSCHATYYSPYTFLDLCANDLRLEGENETE